MTTTEKPVTANSLHHESHITSHVAPWLTKLVYPLADKLVFPYFFNKIEILGKENVPKNGAVIVAPTHRSRWDALVVPYATGRMVSGRDPHFMVSVDEIKGIQGWFIRRLGGFPVNTQRLGLESLRHSFDLLSQGEMVVIFPEGNIFREDKVQPLKRGIAKIALEVEETNPTLDIKILPVTIKYNQTIPRRGCSVFVNIGTCLTVSNYCQGSIRERSIILTRDLQDSLEQGYLSKS